MAADPRRHAGGRDAGDWRYGWLWPGAPWWVYAGGGFIVGALLYTKLIELIAYETIMDRDKE